MNFHFLVQANIQNLAEIGSVATEKSMNNFNMYITLGQGQEMTLTFNTHISSFSQLVSGRRLQ